MVPVGPVIGLFRHQPFSWQDSDPDDAQLSDRGPRVSNIKQKPHRPLHCIWCVLYCCLSPPIPSPPLSKRSDRVVCAEEHIELPLPNKGVPAPADSTLRAFVVDGWLSEQRIDARSGHACRDMTPHPRWAARQQPHSNQRGDDDDNDDELLFHAVNVATSEVSDGGGPTRSKLRKASARRHWLH